MATFLGKKAQEYFPDKELATSDPKLTNAEVGIKTKAASRGEVRLSLIVSPELNGTLDDLGQRISLHQKRDP